MNTISRITVPAKLENLGKLMETVLDAARTAGFDDTRLSHIELAVEEAVVNICNYAYPDGEGDAEIICRSDEETFVIEIINSGVPFDITSVADPDTTADIAEREIGGLGIFFMKKLMDDLRYTRDGSRNILSLVLKRTPG